MTKVFSLGGSLVAPNSIDLVFINNFKKICLDFLAKDTSNKLVLIVGGGAPARVYQEAARNIRKDITNDELDWIGIAATRLNAELVKASFGDLVQEAIVDNPEKANFKSGRILVACGWKPGFSSDFDAVMLGHIFKANEIVNLSNIDYVYTADPKKDPNATIIKDINWADFRKIVGNEWIPGANLPFDPIAARYADEHKLNVVIAKGSNLDNLRAILNDEPYIGTTIKP